MFYDRRYTNNDALKYIDHSFDTMPDLSDLSIECPSVLDAVWFGSTGNSWATGAKGRRGFSRFSLQHG